MNFLAALKFFISVLPFIRQVVLAVEALHGPGNGPSKLDKAVTAVTALLPAQEVETAKSVDELLPHVISHTVSLMNDAGELPKPDVSPVG